MRTQKFFWPVSTKRGYACAIIVHTWANQLIRQLLMDQFDTLYTQCRHIEHMHEGVWFTKTYYSQKVCGLLILTSFSMLTITLRGYQISIAHCLFFIFSRKNPTILQRRFNVIQLLRICCSHMSLVLRKPVFGVFDQVPHKPGCTATEDG